MSMYASGMSNQKKQEMVKNYPTVVKTETAALTALSQGLGKISTTLGKEAKLRTTPMTGISTVYDQKTEVT